MADRYVDVEHGYMFDVQSDLPWTQTNRMTLRAPAIANRIFDTLAHAQAYIDDISPKASAVPGLLLSVFADTLNDKNNGFYRVVSVRKSAGDAAGVLEKVGSGGGGASLVEVTNITTDLAEYAESNVYFISNTVTGEKYQLLVGVLDGVTTQILWGVDSWKKRTLQDESGDEAVWSEWETLTYEVTANKVTSWSDVPSDTKYPSEKLVKESLDEKANKVGTYQGLVAGGLVGSDTDATKDERVSFMFRSTAGSQSITSGDSKVTEVFGNVVNGQPFNSRYFGSSSDNHYNKDNYLRKTINSDGSITSSSAHRIAWLEVMACSIGDHSNNGYTVRDREGFITPHRVGFTTQDPTTATSVTVLSPQTVYGERSAYVPTSHGYLLIDLADPNILDDLFVTLAWSKNPDWQEFKEAIVELPIIHPWGYGKAGSVMDYVSTLEQVIVKSVDRTLLTDMTWVEEEVAGDGAYSDTTLETLIGNISSASSTMIVVEGVSYSRYSDGDVTGAYAWKNSSDEIIYTAIEVPDGDRFTYTSESLMESIKASTTNLDYYGLASSLGVSVTNDRKVVIVSHSRVTPSTEFSEVYLYYELATQTITPYEGQLKSYAYDFGYERFFGGNNVPPTYTTIFYLQNLTDEIRALVRRDIKRRSYTVTFKNGETMAFDVNMEGALSIVRVKTFNVATLRITTGSYVQHQLLLTDGLWQGNLPVADLSLITWEATYIDSAIPASIGVNYEN